MRPSPTLRRRGAARLTLAALTVAAPAGAFAAHGAIATGQTAPAAVHLSVSPRNVAYGHPVAIRGSVPAGDGVVVQLQPHHSAGWRTLGTTSAGPSGAFALHAVPRLSGAVRAVAEPAASGETADAVAAVGAVPTESSSIEPVTVRARFALARRHYALRGQGRVSVRGRLLPAARGRVVRLQGHTGRGWRTLARSRTGGRGGFTVRYLADAVSGQRLRVLFSGDAGNARATGSAGTVTVFAPDLASWYEDGGNTACGFHAGLGVANRTLACGTRVTFAYGGRTVVATVDDRGPFVGGRNWDLNQNTAAALGFAGVGTVWVSR